MENTKVQLREKIHIKIKNFFANDLKMKLLVGYLTINLMYLLIGSYIFSTEKIINWFHYKEFSYGLKYLFIANVIVFLVILIHKWRKKDLKSIKKPIYLGILLCIFWGIISTIFAFDRNIALEGCWGRYEGLFSILYYLTLMLLSTFITKKYKKFLVNIILICGLVQVLYAICQVFNLFNVKQVFHNKELWILGLTKNPNFFGTYMLLCLSYSLGLVIDSKKIKSCIIYGLLSCLFMFGLLTCNTASSAVGLIFVLIYIFIYCLKNKFYEKFLAVFIIVLSITCLTVCIKKTTLVKDIIKIGKEATEVVKGNFDDSFGTKRMFIWKNTLKIVPDHIWHGVGIDSFHKAFNGSFLVRFVGNKGKIYDKAHNEYLQTLVTQGIFALASYLFVYGYVVYKGTKNAFKNKEIYLILPVIGYLVQAFFNISVIEVAPIFYIALGLCCNNEKIKNSVENSKISNEKNFNIDDSVTVLLATYKENKEIFSKALESILNQTYSNIKVLIIVDNKDNKEIIELINNYKENDNRISYLINEQSLGLAESLNKGIDIIDTKYIARMDADDIAFENRIEKQLKYAKENPQINLFGSNVRYIDYEGNVLYDRKKHDMKLKKIKEIVKYINIFSHPTFFGKTEIFKRYKYRNIKYSQDYDFICRLLEDNCIIGNMGECLLYCRKPNQINEEKIYMQKITKYCIQKLYKKSNLIDTDIQNYIQKSLSKNERKKEKITKGFLLHDRALKEFKQKEYFKAFGDIFHSLFLSKYQLREISNLINYEMIK